MDEQISLRCLDRNLPKHQRIVVKPVGLDISIPDCESISFPDHYFASIADYSQLLLSPFFYEIFAAFDYILIYQLDCLVFSGSLDNWCELGYDYIGSPLFYKDPARSHEISRVGNGGLSLRKVKSFLKVLNSDRYLGESISFWKEFLFTHIPDLKEWPLFQRWRKKAQILRQVRAGIKKYTENYTLNEDLFWSDRAQLFDPDFKIAPIETALQFSFERNPSICFEKNNYELPFGCHAWAKWDRAFWEPVIQKEN